MLSLLALLAQTASVAAAPATTLPADIKTAALTCAQAAPLAGAGTSQMRLTAQVTYYMMQAAKADPGGKPFLDRTAELAPKPVEKSMTGEAVRALLAQCDRRFPLARAAAVVKLPADSFDADVVCLGTFALLQGAAQQLAQNGGDDAPVEKIKAAIAPLTARMTDDAIHAHGIATDVAFAAYMGERLKATLDQGNPEAVARACGLASL